MNPPLKPGACRCWFGAVIPQCDHRLHDGSPGAGRDDPCREGIRQPSEATRDAEEAILSGTVRPSDVPTGGAGTARVPGIDQDNWHPELSRLVGDEALQL